MFVRSGATFRSSSTMMYTRPDSTSRFDRTSAATGRPSERERGCVAATGSSIKRKRLNRLRLAILEDFEILGGQTTHEIARRVLHGHVDVDDVDADFEGGLLRWRRLLRECRPKGERHCGGRADRRGECRVQQTRPDGLREQFPVVHGGEPIVYRLRIRHKPLAGVRNRRRFR